VARVTVTVNRLELGRVLRGSATREVERVTRETWNGARQRAPVDEGTLRASLLYRVETGRTRVTGTVWSPLQYALYVHEGTGIYGPRRRVITPRRHRFLRFEVKPGGPLRAGQRVPARGNRRVVYARFVRGTPPNRFLTDALEEVSPYPVVRRDR